MCACATCLTRDRDLMSSTLNVGYLTISKKLSTRSGFRGLGRIKPNPSSSSTTTTTTTTTISVARFELWVVESTYVNDDENYNYDYDENDDDDDDDNPKMNEREKQTTVRN
ncbi:hypothetical protein M0804_015486 [Polistes exclamans]|nr:hypothetical protein M0804_015486 [Polistes exclamans]